MVSISNGFAGATDGRSANGFTAGSAELAAEIVEDGCGEAGLLLVTVNNAVFVSDFARSVDMTWTVFGCGRAALERTTAGLGGKAAAAAYDVGDFVVSVTTGTDALGTVTLRATTLSLSLEETGAEATDAGPAETVVVPKLVIEGTPEICDRTVMLSRLGSACGAILAVSMTDEAAVVGLVIAALGALAAASVALSFDGVETDDLA